MKKYLKLTTLILIIFIIGYFCSSFIILSDKEIKENFFIQKKYITEDLNNFIYFNNLSNIKMSHDDNYYEVIKFNYEENIMTFETFDKKIYLIVIDENKIYCSTFNEYYYLYDIGGK